MTLRPLIAPLLRTALLGLAWLGASLPTQAACDVQWQITPQLQATPRTLALQLSFNPGARSRSLLRLPAGWQALQAADDQPVLQPVADDPTLRSLAHAPNAPLTLRWRVTPAAGDAALRLEADWLALAGQALLPVPDDAGSTPQALCVTIDGVPAASRFAGSFGPGQGERWQWQFNGSAVQAQTALYAGGALQLVERQADGQAVRVALPDSAGLALPTEALVTSVLNAASAQRRFWRDSDSPPLTVLALPGPARGTPEGATLGAAVLLQLPTDLAQPSARLDAALTEALLRQRLPDRLGPRVHAGRRDEALRAWLAEGLVAFYTHRLLLQGGAWTPDDYATDLNRRIERYLTNPVLAADNLKVATGWMADPALAELPAARGEWLALHWHGALRAAGQPGLDAVLRKLMLPAAQARREGPLSAPLASHRLIAALRQTLDDVPLRDITERIDRGVPFAFQADTLGPCFRMTLAQRPDWRLGFDRASLQAGVLRGVEPGGPAEAAGLRDGMAVRGYRVVQGDVEQPVWLQVQDIDGSQKTISYQPAGTRLRELPRYAPVLQALQQPACQGWLNGEGGNAVALGRALTGPQPVSSRAALAQGGKAAKAAKGGKGAKGSKAAHGAKAAKGGGKSAGKAGKAGGGKAATGAKSSAKGGAKAGAKASKARH